MPLDLTDPAELLREALNDLGQARAEWEKAGRPLLGTGSQGQQIQHPLLSTIHACTRIVVLLDRAPASMRGGRPQGAQSAPDRKAQLASQRARLKPVTSTRGSGNGSDPA